MKKEIKSSLIFATAFAVIDLAAYLLKIDNTYFLMSATSSVVLNVILNVIVDFVILFIVSLIIEKIMLFFKKKKN